MRVEDLVAGLGELLHAPDLPEPGAQVVGQLVERVELAGELGELVVRRRQLALLDGRDRRRDLGVAVGVLAGDELRGEGRRLPRRQPAHGLVEAVDQAALAHLVGEAAGRGLLDGLAVHGGRQVEQHEVVVGRRALDTGQRAEPGAQVVELLGDRGLVHLDVVHGDGDGVEVGQRDLRADVDLGGEREVVAVGDLGDLDVGTADGADVVGAGDGLGVLGRDRRVDDLVEHHAPAQPRLQDARGRLARPEAGDAHLLGDLAVRAVEVRLELVERHLDVDPDARRAEPLDGALHGGHSSELVRRRGPAGRDALRNDHGADEGGATLPASLSEPPDDLPAARRCARRGQRRARSSSTQSPHTPPPGTR